MLIRGANAVGYKSYPDNVVVESIKLAAANGIDVFRIFDCFNDMEQMQLCIDTVRQCNKIAEVAICFTGNFLSADEKIYTLDYYKDMVNKVVKAGAHIIAIKVCVVLCYITSGHGWATEATDGSTSHESHKISHRHACALPHTQHIICSTDDVY